MKWIFNKCGMRNVLEHCMVRIRGLSKLLMPPNRAIAIGLETNYKWWGKQRLNRQVWATWDGPTASLQKASCQWLKQRKSSDRENPKPVSSGLNKAIKSFHLSALPSPSPLFWLTSVSSLTGRQESVQSRRKRASSYTSLLQNRDSFPGVPSRLPSHPIGQIGTKCPLLSPGYHCGLRPVRIYSGVRWGG